MVILPLLLACADPVVPPVEGPAPLDTPRLARRLSLDLRGVLPSAEELAAVRADPAALDALAEGWLQDPRLEDRVVALLHERWHTRVDGFNAAWYDFGLAREDEVAFERAVGEEPLRLAAALVVEDRPWSELVTAGWTRANPLLLQIWPLEPLEPGDGWVRARWTDDRPEAGVLVSSGLWWRYPTTMFNLNRARAAAISRLLLCEDLLARPVRLSEAADLLSSGAEEALRSDPACLSCHAALEPMAAALFGFHWVDEYAAVEMTHYHPEREPLGERLLQVEPGFYGTPVADLAGLGQAIAADGRFEACAVRTFAEALWRRAAGPEDQPALVALRGDFRAAGMRVRPLLLRIVQSAEYQAGTVLEGPAQSRRLLSPDQLASAVEELTGYRWTWAGVDQLDEDEEGFRALAGGVDGEEVLTPQRDPGLTWALVLRRLAEAAGEHAARVGLEEGAGPLAGLGGLTPGDPAFDEAYVALVWRVVARAPSAEEQAEDAALWRAVAAEEGEQAAWAALLSLWLRDLDAVTL